MYSVPFSIDEYEGFLQTRGIVRIEEEAVVLEFKKQEGSPKPSCGKWTINDAPRLSLVVRGSAPAELVDSATPKQAVPGSSRISRL